MPRALRTLICLLLGLAALCTASAGAAEGGDPTVRAIADGELRFADPDVGGETHRLSGELVEIADHDDAPGRDPYLLETPSGRLVDVEFGDRDLPESATNAEVRAQVTEAGEVRSAEIDPAPISAAAARPTAHRAYVARVANRGTYPDGDGDIQAMVDRGLQRWRAEANGAITTFTRADFRSLTADNDCSSGPAMWNEAATKLYPNVRFGAGTGNHLIVIAPSACAGGIGTVGSGIGSGGRISMNYSPSKNPQTLLHELGHNFGLGHARACVRSGASACTDSEYGNRYAIMGTTMVGTPAFDPAAIDSFERERLDIASPGEIRDVTLAAGRRSATTTHDLRARGADAGLRGLRVTDPVTGAVYFVDWRSAGGRDAGAYYASSIARAQAQDYDPGVTVQRMLADRSASVLQSFARSDRPSGGRFARIGGEVFAADGVRVSVASIGSSTDPSATSRVTITLTDPSGAQGGGSVGISEPPLARGADGAATDRPVAPAPAGSVRGVLSGGVAIAGVPGVGSVLRAEPRAWPSRARLAYQWYEGGRPIAGARGESLRVSGAMRGRRLSVRIRGTMSGYAERTTVSGSVLAGRFASTARLRIAGAGRWYRARSAASAWTPRPTAVRYRWYIGKRRIRGATGPLLERTRARVRAGRRLRVQMVASRPGFERVRLRARARPQR